MCCGWAGLCVGGGGVGVGGNGLLSGFGGVQDGIAKAGFCWKPGQFCAPAAPAAGALSAQLSKHAARETPPPPHPPTTTHTHTPPPPPRSPARAHGRPLLLPGCSHACSQSQLPQRPAVAQPGRTSLGAAHTHAGARGVGGQVGSLGWGYCSARSAACRRPPHTQSQLWQWHRVQYRLPVVHVCVIGACVFAPSAPCAR